MVSLGFLWLESSFFRTPRVPGVFLLQEPGAARDWPAGGALEAKVTEFGTSPGGIKDRDTMGTILVIVSHG